MGVGLSLVKILVDLHGGTVDVRSDGPNQGSEFTVRIPLTKKTPHAQTARPVPTGASSARVLVVEDNDDSRQMLEQLLRLDGYDVTVAADGLAGLQVLERGEIEVALVDIGLPGISGYELAQKVRSEPRLRPVRLIALTGYGREEDHRQVLSAGFDEHLVKPVRPEDLVRVLRKPR
jgi:CheY-like chemotaxis protein